MKTNNYLDIRLITGIALAHILIYFSFHDKAIFWYIFSGSILVLIAFSMYHGDVEDKLSFFKYITYGTTSGILLYFLMRFGLMTLEFLHPPFTKNVIKLYAWYSPTLFWEYIALLIAAAPGEEIFWRGFIQTRLLKFYSPITSIFFTSLLYSSVHIYSHSFLLILAAFVSGFFWGFLYLWKKSMPLVIVSHITFDLLIFIFYPFG